MKYTSIVLAFLIISAPLCNASTPSNISPTNTIHSGRFSASSALGFLTGISNEYVYADSMDDKLSELDWKIKGAAIIKGDISYNLLHWLTANISGWTTLGKGSGVMDDYDWLNPNQSQWTHWSHSPNTHLNYANEVDFNLKDWIAQNEQYKVGVTAGYLENKYSFLAKGGCYDYYNGEYTGCWQPNQRGIGYKQDFNTLYLGLVGHYVIQNFEFDATLKISPWVESKDIDQHYLRNLTFKEYGNNSNFYSAAISAGYNLTRSTKLFSEFSFNQFTNGIADTLVVDQDTGYYGYSENSAGLSNKNFIISLGIKYTPAWG